MTDKEKIKKYLVEKLSEVLHLHTESAIVCRKVYQEAITFVDSMDEEPVSEQNLSKVQSIGKNWKEPVSEEWIEELRTKLYSLSKEDFEKVMAKYSKYGGEEPVSEDLNTAAKEYANNITDNLGFKLQLRRAVCFGAQWKEQQFEKNRLKHCNSITNEQAELEQGFIDQHLDKHHRMPTFLDAIEYGMRLREQQMMARAVDGEVGYWNLRGLSVNVELPRSVNEGDRVKVIIIKEG